MKVNVNSELCCNICNKLYVKVACVITTKKIIIINYLIISQK